MSENEKPIWTWSCAEHPGGRPLVIRQGATQRFRGTLKEAVSALVEALQDLDSLRRQLAQRDEQLDAKEEEIGEWKQASCLIVNGDPAPVTPDMLEASRQADDAELDRLKASVEKLPKTADGVPVVPDQTIYFTFGTTLCEATSFMKLAWPRRQYSPTTISRCYSTREAAEQAKAAEAACPDGAEKGEGDAAS